MKRNNLGIWFCIIVLMLVSLISCQSVYTTHQDPSIPWQQHALLYLAGSYRGGASIHGVDTLTKHYLIVQGNSVVIIPPGTHTVYVHLWNGQYGTTYETRVAIPITFDFQPGGRYVLSGEIGRGYGPAAKIQTVEEYRLVHAGLYPNDTPEQNEKTFNSRILDNFKKAEVKLSEKK